MKFPKEKSHYLLQASLASVCLIVSYLLFLSYVLTKALRFNSFTASDGASIAIEMVLYGGIMAGLFFAVSGAMAKVSIYALASAFSLYEAISSYDRLYEFNGDPFYDSYRLMAVAAGMVLLLAFLFGALSFVLSSRRVLFLRVSRVLYGCGGLLYLASAIVIFFRGDLLLGLSLLALAFRSLSLPFALKALDLLPEALREGL